MLSKDFRLPHSLRLSQSSTFKYSFFLLKYAPNGQATPRFGVIISKKIDKHAVKRNRMRRLLHTFIQDNLALFPQNNDYLFIVTKLFEDQPDDLLVSLGSYFQKQNV